MMKKLILILAAFAFAPLASAQMIQGGVAGTICGGLGGPHYCVARTDHIVTLTPATLPSVGGSTGAGNCTSQPGYANNEVCRVTDFNFENPFNASHQHFQPCCGGSADFPEWSADSRMFLVQDNGGFAFLARMDDSVDPPIFSCVGTGNVWISPTTGCIEINTWLGGGSAPTGSVDWDATDPLVFYAPESSSQMWKFTLDGATANPPAATMLFDLATAPNCAPSAGAGIGPWRPSWDGQKFGGIFSPNGQDVQYQVFYYDLAQGCRWMNTLTWQIGGNWGPTGTANVQPSIGVTNSSITGGIATVTLAASGTGLPMKLKNPATFTITAASNASPIVLTTSAGCSCNNEVVGVSGVLGNTAANGTWFAAQSGTSVTLTHINGTASAGNGAYTSGGTLYASGSFVAVSGLTHCTACNGAPMMLTSVSGTTVNYVANSADVSSGADSGSMVPAGQLHEVAMSGDGNSLLLSVSANQGQTHPFWQAATLNVFMQPGIYNGNTESGLGNGHYAFEFSHFVNATQGTSDNSFCGLGISTTDVPMLTAMGFFIPTLSQCPWTGSPLYDEHLSVSTAVHSDAWPAFHETVNLESAPDTTHAAMQDIVAQSYSNLGKTSRFCTTYQDTYADNIGSAENQPFAAWEGTGTVSPNGKWYVFSSDWGSTLGMDTAWTITSGSWSAGTETITVSVVQSTNPFKVGMHIGVNSNQSDVNGLPFTVTAVGGVSGAWTFSYALAASPALQPTGGNAGGMRADVFVCRLR